ncbi:hypothetical protein ACJX0J_032113, partial [Zea mays]
NITLGNIWLIESTFMYSYVRHDIHYAHFESLLGHKCIIKVGVCRSVFLNFMYLNYFGTLQTVSWETNIAENVL